MEIQLQEANDRLSAALERNGHGKPDPFSEMERVVRKNAEEPPEATDPHLHDFLKHARGVIHVGAHTGQERDIYGQLPVIWVEALPMVYDVLLEKIAGYPRQKAYQHLVADGRRCHFGLASNACHSSSIFDLKGHRDLWPDVGYVAATEMESVTLSQVIKRHGIDLDVYDALILDVQGAELLVLKGAGDYLSRFRWIMAEAADFEAYAGGCQLRDLDEYLTRRGFVREKLVPCFGRPGVGSYYEAVYRNTERPAFVEHAPGNGCKAGWTEPAATKDPVRLNLGAGNIHLSGFTAIDRKTGGEVYPLQHPDGSVEEIVASHVLEHFSHRDVLAVVSNWVAKLRPGGKIRLAVPDFDKLATLYREGAPCNVMGYIMGGHVDADDRHGCIFDRDTLAEVMTRCGLERIGEWVSDIPGCSQDPLSLNLQGFKPLNSTKTVKGVRGVACTPRFGPLLHPECIQQASFALGIEFNTTQSCYWAQELSNKIEAALDDPTCEYVLTLDFDTVFSPDDVRELYRLMQARPDADAIFPLQSKRGCDNVLASLPAPNGKYRMSATEEELAYNLRPANTGHMGLTLFRADSLRRFPRPWMVPEPNAEGRWDGGHRDADIDFWVRFRAAGFNCFLAPRVVVGHLEEVVKWPGKDLRPVYQDVGDYREKGIPATVER